MTAPLAAVWLLLDYPWGLLAFVAIAALNGLRRVRTGHSKVTARAGYF
jgi:hypothetical protein